MIFEPTYIPYKIRLKANIIKALFLALIYGIMLTLTIYKSKDNIETAVIIFSSCYILTLALNFKTDRIYLKSISFDDENVIIVFVDKDAEIEHINIPIEKIMIQIKSKSLFLWNGLFSGNYRIEFHELFKDKYRFKNSQIDLQIWNSKNFKEVYDYYLKIKSSSPNENRRNK